MNHNYTCTCTMCDRLTQAARETTLPRVIPLSEVRVGDTVRVEWPEGDVTLSSTAVVVRIDDIGNLRSAAHRIIGPWYMSGRGDLTVHLLDRPAPSLPTEPGSVIVDATIRGVEGCTAICEGEDIWTTVDYVEGYLFHDPRDITAWTPARIVADGEPVTL